MKKLFILFFLSAIVSFSTYSHSYYFSYAEVEYNDFCACFQVSLSLTTHDFEQVLRKNNILKKDLETSLSDSTLKSKIETFINEGFEIQTNGQKVHLKIDGNEIQLNGITTFYMSSNKIEISDKVNFRYDLLMKEFPDEQNKITFLFRNKKETINFYTNHISQLIKLEE
jgi:hypothetical protein